MTLAEEVIEFIEDYCLVPEGRHVGQPIVLAPFQRKFITDVYDNEAGTRRAYLTMARKNGKTATIAALMLAYLCGPLSVRNAQVVSGALSRDQAALVFNLAAKMVMLHPEVRHACRIIPSSKRIIGLADNVEYHALSADAGTAHGLSPVLAILDEVGQIAGPSSPFVEAIETSQGAHESPLLIAISTQAPSDASMFSLWLDDAERNEDPHIISQVHAADPDGELLDEKQWEQANPALGLFRSKKDLATQLQQAQRMPTRESSARNLLLNQRVSLQTIWLSPNVWKKNKAPPDLDVFRNNTTVAAYDLSARNDLTACCLAAKDEAGFVHLWPLVFCPLDGVEDRGRRDRVPYPLWIQEGQMIPLGGASMDYAQIVEYMRGWFDDNEIDPAIVAFDRWRWEIFKQECDRQGLHTAAEFRPVGQGFKDMSPRCEAMESLLLEGKMCHGGHPLLNMAASNAIAVRSPAGDLKLDKSKATQRIDPLIAALMATFEVSEGMESESIDVASLIV